VYEPGSFVPLLRISQAMDQNSPKTEAEATEANARGLLALASQHGKPAKPVNPDDTAKAPIQLPGFGTAQWAALSSSFAQVAQKGYPEHMKTILRQGGLDPDKLTEMAKAAVAQQQAEDTAKLTIQMYHCNHLGTPIALINQSGLIDWAVELDPWGNVLNEFNPNEIDQPIRMQGQQIDRESGLFYNRHRYYDPQMGRYITQDPIGLAGGNNLYGYVEGEPTIYIDPLGQDRWGTETMRVYTDRAANKTSVFDPSKGKVLEFETRTASVGKPGADGPYSGKFTYCQSVPEGSDGTAGGGFGPLKWRTTDPRGRWVHGGGTGLDDPYNAPRQGWKPTLGCTRAQNEDVKELCDITTEYKKQNPGKDIPYERK
jgi:RHS repeat-associated protein